MHTKFNHQKVNPMFKKKTITPKFSLTWHM